MHNKQANSSHPRSSYYAKKTPTHRPRVHPSKHNLNHPTRPTNINLTKHHEKLAKQQLTKSSPSPPSPSPPPQTNYIPEDSLFSTAFPFQFGLILPHPLHLPYPQNRNTSATQASVLSQPEHQNVLVKSTSPLPSFHQPQQRTSSSLHKSLDPFKSIPPSAPLLVDLPLNVNSNIYDNSNPFLAALGAPPPKPPVHTPAAPVTDEFSEMFTFNSETSPPQRFLSTGGSRPHFMKNDATTNAAKFSLWPVPESHAAISSLECFDDTTLMDGYSTWDNHVNPTNIFVNMNHSKPSLLSSQQDDQQPVRSTVSDISPLNNLVVDFQSPSLSSQNMTAKNGKFKMPKFKVHQIEGGGFISLPYLQEKVAIYDPNYDVVVLPQFDPKKARARYYGVTPIDDEDEEQAMPNSTTPTV